MTHFTYKDAGDPCPDLEQGDVLRRTDGVVAVLHEYHPYYIDKSANEHFVVLSQSCDLVRRDGGQPKTRYITVAPARAMRSVVEREFGKLIKRPAGTMKPIGTTETQERLEAFLVRVCNNNDAKYFFLQAAPDQGLAEDMCVILGLAISIKVDHYQQCLDARFLQLKEVFQAKMGWLLGQQFTRVATTDWEEDALNVKVAGVLAQTAVWLPERTRDHVTKELAAKVAANVGYVADEVDLVALATSAKTRKDEVIDSVLNTLIAMELLPEGRSTKRFQLRQRLDAELAKYLPRT